MTSLKPIMALALCALVAACTTPQQRCVDTATRDLRNIDALIAETQANLQRGYAIERDTEVRPRLTFCTGYGGFGGYGRYYGTGVNFCTTQDVVTRTRNVAIDPAAEKRKLASLQQRRASIEPATQRALVSCNALAN